MTKGSAGVLGPWAHLKLHIVWVGVIVGSKLSKPDWDVPAVRQCLPPLDNLPSRVSCVKNASLHWAWQIHCTNTLILHRDLHVPSC